jgi:hypothetical protein
MEKLTHLLAFSHPVAHAMLAGYPPFLVSGSGGIMMNESSAYLSALNFEVVDWLVSTTMEWTTRDRRALRKGRRIFGVERG